MKFTQTVTDWDSLPVLMTLQTACQLLQCSDRTVIRHVKNGDFLGNRLGKGWLIDRDSVRAFFTTFLEDGTEDE